MVFHRIAHIEHSCRAGPQSLLRVSSDIPHQRYHRQCAFSAARITSERYSAAMTVLLSRARTLAQRGSLEKPAVPCTTPVIGRVPPSCASGRVLQRSALSRKLRLCSQVGYAAVLEGDARALPVQRRLCTACRTAFPPKLAFRLICLGFLLFIPRPGPYCYACVHTNVLRPFWLEIQVLG